MNKKHTPKYIKNKDGTFAGSIGTGNSSVPKPAPKSLPVVSGYLDPSEGRGQMVAMAASWQQLRVQEEVHQGYVNIDKCLNGSLPDWQMNEKIERLSAMSKHLENDKQYRQAEILANIANDSHVALWAKAENEASQAEDDDPVMVEVDTAAMYQNSLRLAQDAAWDDLAALDENGTPIAKRSIEAYEKYGSA